MSNADHHSVRKHKRNQYFPAEGVHREIVIDEHRASNPRVIWQLVTPEGEVREESEKRADLEHRLSMMGMDKREWVAAGWTIVRRKPSPKTKLAPIPAPNHIWLKPAGVCRKCLACQEPETPDEVVCPGCGSEWTRWQIGVKEAA